MNGDGADSSLTINTGSRPNGPQSYGYDGVFGYPDASDLTDALLQKTRTNFAMRLMMGKSQSNSFGAQAGGLNLGAPGAGGF